MTQVEETGLLKETIPAVGEKLVVERASLADVPQVQALIKPFADRDLMLPRSLEELYQDLRDYFVVKNGERVVGCAALHVMWHDQAELKALAVAPEFQGQGLGRKLVEACLEEARWLGLAQVYTLTLSPEFFNKLGFHRVSIATLPRKLWSECYRCPKLTRCDEIAMVYDL